MLTRKKVDHFEKLTGQLTGIHDELSALAKKTPNDAVNLFKLKFVNAVLTQCNELLGSDYRPFGDFKEFDADTLPSNSDVTFIASQYLQALEKFRSDNVIQSKTGWWVYAVKDGEEIRAAPPAKLER